MATLKQRLHKKNSSGSYDVVHLETSAGLVLMSDGTTVEAAVNSKAASSHTHSGYAASSHSHAAGDITSGTLPLTRGGTGVTTLAALKTALGISGSSSSSGLPEMYYYYSRESANANWTINIGKCGAILIFGDSLMGYDGVPGITGRIIKTGESTNVAVANGNEASCRVSLNSTGTTVTVRGISDGPPYCELYFMTLSKYVTNT